MRSNEKLFREIEEEARKLETIKQQLASSLYYMFHRYAYSIDREKYWIRGITLKLGKYKAKMRKDWYGDYFLFKVYVGGEMCININHYTDSSNYAPNILKVNIDKLLELQDFHNQLVDVTTENLILKKEKFEKLNNFTLALKELEE